MDAELRDDVARCTRKRLARALPPLLPLPASRRRNRAAAVSAQPLPQPPLLLPLCAREFTPASHAKELAAVHQ